MTNEDHDYLLARALVVLRPFAAEARRYSVNSDRIVPWAPATFTLGDLRAAAELVAEIEMARESTGQRALTRSA
jgi:hypothetical protein